jgi:hypothetical protein
MGTQQAFRRDLARQSVSTSEIGSVATSALRFLRAAGPSRVQPARKKRKALVATEPISDVDTD